MLFKRQSIKATFSPNISIEKFCQSAKRIIGVSSAAVVRDVFATTASFKRCTVLHNAFPVCTTVYVFQANSTRTLAPWRRARRPLQNTSTHHAVSSWLLDPGRYAVHTKAYYNGRIWKWTSQDLFCTEDRSRIAPGGPPFLRSIIVEMFGGNVALMCPRPERVMVCKQYLFPTNMANSYCVFCRDEGRRTKS